MGSTGQSLESNSSKLTWATQLDPVSKRKEGREGQREGGRKEGR
jgi:hypothetical protein